MGAEKLSGKASQYCGGRGFESRFGCKASADATLLNRKILNYYVTS